MGGAAQRGTVSRATILILCHGVGAISGRVGRFRERYLAVTQPRSTIAPGVAVEGRSSCAAIVAVADSLTGPLSSGSEGPRRLVRDDRGLTGKIDLDGSPYHQWRGG